MLSCSVCATTDSSLVGGVLLWERNGEISAICSECWATFSNVSSHKRIIKNDAQSAALKVLDFLSSHRNII